MRDSTNDRSRRPEPGHMVPVALPCPPTLHDAVGYTDGARYIALHWSPYGDDLIVHDGPTLRTANWPAWLTFTRHPVTRATLGRYEFGSSDTAAEHWLLVDRLTQRLTVGLPDDVTTLLRSQPNVVHAFTADMTNAQAAEYVRSVVAAAPPPTGLQLSAMLQQTQATQAALTARLDDVLKQALAADPVVDHVSELPDAAPDVGTRQRTGSAVTDSEAVDPEYSDPAAWDEASGRSHEGGEADAGRDLD